MDTTTPFVYGKLAVLDNFTNRKKEVNKLITNFNSNINTILISPRRLGKSSLVFYSAKKASELHKELRFCFIDMFNVRTEEQFYQLLAQEIVQATANKVEGIVDLVKKFLGSFIPKVSFNPTAESSFQLGLDWKEVKKNPDEILNLSEKIAEKKNFKFVICIDEFQNLSNFENPLAFQKKLRSNWQKHQLTSYCLFGSKRHMLIDVFTNSAMPFYKFGDIIFLQKIKKEDWIPFIIKRFADTGKKIHEKQAAMVSELADCHPYYVQQLAQQTWLRTDKECTDEIVLRAFEDLIDQLSLLFQTRTDELSQTQVNLMEAVLNGEKQLSSQNVLLKYRLGTSANAIKARNALINKEIIDVEQKRVFFLDPMYKHWLQKVYFKI
ncbi:MAG: ATP-binding protein [Prolixibacteraceae bacterium]|nr:ATP-binding protein [Prolixibacteraceae bacterium]